MELKIAPKSEKVRKENTMIKTLVYCASGTGERVAYSLDDEHYEIVGLVDSNPET